MKDKLLLIDGHSIISRAFYGIPMLTASSGVPTNAVHGFFNIFFKVLEEEEADHAAVAFDLSRHTFRTDIYADYKGTRKPMPEELKEQIPLVQNVLRAMHVPILTLENYEADDILGTCAKRCQREGVFVTILSGDRDLLQLADENIRIVIPKTLKGRTETFRYAPEDVKEQYGATPLEFIDMKALMGDASDNIPGVPSIGEKTARVIIEAYHSIENAYAHAAELKPPRAGKALLEHYDMAQLSKTLATICLTAPLDFDYAASSVSGLYTGEALALLKEYELKSLAARYAAKVSDKMDTASETALSLSGLKVVTDRFLAGIAFSDLSSQETASFQVIADRGDPSRAAAALCLSRDRLYVICSSSDYPAEELLADAASSIDRAIQKKCRFAVCGLKEQLPFIKVRRSDRFDDLSVAAYLMNPLRGSYAYEDIAREFLKADVPSQTELLGKENLLHALFEDPANRKNAEKCLAYTAASLFLSLTPARKALSEKKMLSLFEEIEMPLIYSLYDMQETGVRVDREALERYAAELNEEMTRVEREIHEETGEIFNLNSPQQLGRILFEKLALPGGKKTRTGYSTAADVLQKLAPDYPIVGKILRYRALTKLYSTYAVGLAAFIREDGRIHGTFNQTVTATGRISSTDPNLQNIPVRTEEGKQFRKVFIPREGYVFVDADYSQVELRILAALSGDEKLIKAYRDAVDVHALTASEVFHVPLSEVTPEMRRNAKAVNFGIVYGISAFGLGEDLSIGRREAQDYINRYFETYPGVKRYLDASVEQAKKEGFVRTYFGRIRPIPELSSSNFMQRSFGERVAMNSPIQGTAADIMKIAMNRVNMALSGLAADGTRVSEPMKSRIVLQVHDELLIETAPEEFDEVMILVADRMEHAASLAVRLSAEAKDGMSWYECH